MESLFLFSTLAFVVLVVLVVLSVLIYQKRLWKARLQLQQTQASHRMERMSQAMNTLEKERQRVARELHDGVGGTLATAKLLLQHQEEVLRLQGVSTDHLPEVEKLLENGINGIREAAYDLSPPTLQRLGLKAALIEWRTSTQHHAAFSIALDIHMRNTRLPEQTERIVYRIVQELTSNTLKHARAQSIRLSLRTTSTQAELTYIDDGQGFNPTKNHAGMGLKNLESRVALLQGELTIQTAPGQGTRIDIRWKQPFHHEHAPTFEEDQGHDRR